MEFTLEMLSDDGLEYMLNKYRKQMAENERIIDKIIIERDRRYEIQRLYKQRSKTI